MIDADYDALAAKLAAGVTSVTGDLVADDTWFDSRRLGLEWTWDDEPYQFAAQVSALNISAYDTDFNAGTVFIEVSPGTVGGRPKIKIDPPNKYIRVSGTIPLGGEPAADLPSVWEPTGLVAEIFRKAMAKHGITVDGRTRVGAAAPGDASVLASRDSMPLSEMIVPFMRYSLNSHAEVLVKAVGRATSGAGTWDAGLAAVNAYAASKGMDVDKFVAGDGSGMTRRTYIPTAEIADLLVAVRAEPWFPAWEASLPVAGNPDYLTGGTLRNRMRGTPAEGNVHAKTGSMTGVSALSGYVTDADGRLLVFGIQLNHLVTGQSVKPIEDQIAVALAGYSRNAEGLAKTAVPQVSDPGYPTDVECSWVMPAVC